MIFSNNMKILYSYKFLDLLGISLTIEEYDYHKKNNYLIIKLLNNEDIVFFQKIVPVS